MKYGKGKGRRYDIPAVKPGKFQGGLGFTDRNLIPVDPKKEQFVPTESSMIRQRAKMGGVS